ncbi:MAG: hypothetical protein WD043_06255 [Gemmatimonadales bacterium]
MGTRKRIPKAIRRRLRRAEFPDLPAGGDQAMPPLTPAQLQELERRIRDSEDRTRYLLVSVMTPRFALYYNVSDDCYGHNDPRYATLFKRRAAAEAVRALLGEGVQLVRCRVNSRGALVLRSIPKLRSRG